MTLEEENAELRRLLADRDRQIIELRETVQALLMPAPSELLAKNLAHPSRRNPPSAPDWQSDER